MALLLRLERKQKDSSNPFRIRIFFFLSYSFGIETIKTIIQSGSFLKNHIRFQTKMGKAYTRFQTKTAQKPDPMGRHMHTQEPSNRLLAHTYAAYIREYPPPGVHKTFRRQQFNKMATSLLVHRTVP